MHLYIYIYAYTCIYIYIYIYKHTHTHIHIHTSIHIFKTKPVYSFTQLRQLGDQGIQGNQFNSPSGIKI